MSNDLKNIRDEIEKFIGSDNYEILKHNVITFLYSDVFKLTAEDSDLFCNFKKLFIKLFTLVLSSHKSKNTAL